MPLETQLPNQSPEAFLAPDAEYTNVEGATTFYDKERVDFGHARELRPFEEAHAARTAVSAAHVEQAPRTEFEKARDKGQALERYRRAYVLAA